MLLTILFIFLAAMGLGLYLLMHILQNKKMPKAIALVHGPLAITGIVLLSLYCFWNAPHAVISLVIFILAAFGGGYLFYLDSTGKNIPKMVAIGHGLTAITGFIIFLYIVFG